MNCYKPGCSWGSTIFIYPAVAISGERVFKKGAKGINACPNHLEDLIYDLTGPTSFLIIERIKGH